LTRLVGPVVVAGAVAGTTARCHDASIPLARAALDGWASRVESSPTTEGTTCVARLLAFPDFLIGASREIVFQINCSLPLTNGSGFFIFQFRFNTAIIAVYTLSAHITSLVSSDVVVVQQH
jgi:hypothetical protein